MDLPLCLCGCKNTVTREKNTYLRGHNGFTKSRIGIPLPLSTREKISASLKGRPISERHRLHLRSLSVLKRGVPLSPETRKKISLARVSPETRKKRSLAAISRFCSSEERKRISEALKQYWKNKKLHSDITVSPETKKKMSDAATARWLVTSTETKKKLSDATIARLQRHHQKFSGTKIETIVRSLCTKSSIQIRHNVPIFTAGANVDILIEEYRLIIEADGCWYHDCPSCYPKNNGVHPAKPNRDARLNAAGYTVLHFWEHDILNNLPAVESQILAAIDGKS